MPDPAAGSDSRTRQRWTLLAVCVATFMLLVDITIVNVGLPSIQRDTAASLTGLQWVVDAYALSLAALMLSAGALADRVGRRAVFTAGVALFTLASLVCGVSSSITMLDVARGVQGIGGAAMFATALALIAQEFHGAERGGALAAWGATVGGAVAVGPLAGGVLTDALSWRWIFFVNVPIGAVALAIAMLRLGDSRDPSAGRLDLGGLVTFTAALFALVLGLLRGNAEGWGSPRIIAALIGAAVLMVLFVLIERRRARPMLDLALFREPPFVGVSIAVFCLGAGMFAMVTFLAVYLQDVPRYSPLQAGLRLLPFTAFVFVIPLVTRRLAPRLQARYALGGGMLAVALGLLLMHGLRVDSSWHHLLVGLVLCGIGVGLANPAIGATAIGVVHPSRAGMASGINNTFRLGGIATGIAALGAVFEHRIETALGASAHLHPGAAAVAAEGVRAADRFSGGTRDAIAATAGHAFVAGFNTILLVGAATVLVGALAALALIRRIELRPAPAAQPTVGEAA